MESFDRKKHWETIYQTKELSELSWFEDKPQISLDFIEEFNPPLTARIIDIGGGDSLLVDHLLDLGYQDITVLDISEAALERAKNRLGDRAQQVTWIVADAASFKPSVKYDFWHDRAAFHFLTRESEISSYLQTVQQSLTANGILVIGTFSERGPAKCSGIEIKQYSEESMAERLRQFFQKINCKTVDHTTPFQTSQNFVFCSFRRLQAA